MAIYTTLRVIFGKIKRIINVHEWRSNFIETTWKRSSTVSVEHGWLRHLERLCVKNEEHEGDRGRKGKTRHDAEVSVGDKAKVLILLSGVHIRDGRVLVLIFISIIWQSQKSQLLPIMNCEKYHDLTVWNCHDQHYRERIDYWTTCISQCHFSNG